MGAMRLRLLSFRSADGLALPGLLYEPRRPSTEVALFLHGNGDASVFYSARRTNAFAEEMTRRGVAFFAFPTAILGSGFVDAVSRRRTAGCCPQCGGALQPPPQRAAASEETENVACRTRAV